MYIKTICYVLKISLLTLFFLNTSNSAFAQNVSCFDNVDIDILGSCTYPLDYLLFLESTDVPNDSFYVEVLGGNSLSVNQVTVEQIGENLIYHLVHEPSGKSCWGPITVTNTVAPLLDCPEVAVYCHEFGQTSPQFIGRPTLINACYPDSVYTFEYFDNVANLDCPDEYAFVINRSWTVTDSDGLASTCNQTITGDWLSFSDVIFPEDYDDIANPAIECNEFLTVAMQTDTSITGVPTAFGRELEDFYCEFSATFSDIIVPGCGASREVKRNWTVIDFCTNMTTTHQQIILLNDTEPPVFFIQDTLQASTSENCSSNFNLPPADIQFECSDYEVEIVTPWESFNTNGGIFEFPPIPGDYIITYTFTDDCGNAASKDVAFTVRQAESLRCPSDTTITCKRYFDSYATPLANGNFANLANLGRPTTDENCYFTFENSAIVNVDDCGIGTITHTMSSDDGAFPLNCTQTITVEHLSDFVVEFPEDLILNCDTGPDGYGQPIIFGDNCENVEIAYEDQFFDIVPNVCYKIVRNWTVFNRCISTFDTLNFVPESSELELADNFAECDLNEDGSCGNRTFQDGLNVNNYPTPQPDGVIVYQQIIEVIDETEPVIVNGCDIPDVCIEENSCVAEILLPTPELSDCDFRDTWNVSSAMGQGFGPFSNISIGTVSVSFTVTDKCGNFSSCQSILTVKDCTAPNAICYPELIVELSESNNCETTLNATDISNGTFDNCFGNLVYSFAADSVVAQMTFADSDGPEVPVELFVTDQSGNQSSCSSTITVESDNSCIPPSGEPISGFILRPNGEGVDDVAIDITVNNTTIASATSESDGLYEAAVLFMGSDYKITPTQDAPVGGGVTTFDLVILRKHILGDELITDPYKLIAADVNNSQSVSTLDLVNIRKVILNINQNFPGPSWRFIPADYVFPNPSTPWTPAYPEAIDLMTVPPVYDADFIGVRIGDLN